MEAHVSAVDIDPVELKNLLDGMDDEINNVLEETAHKNRLTAAEVKNILRHVITNENVLAMVRNTMKAEDNEDGDLEEAVFEPKSTPSKVKELREKQHILPWPMSTPVKQPESATKAILDEEFPDESFSDEDYKPNEEEVDKIARRTRSKLPLRDTLLEVSADSLVAPDMSVDMYDTDSDEDTDSDSGEEWQDYLKTVTPKVLESARFLSNWYETERFKVDKIALRTHSKRPLKDTPLEVIADSLVAPVMSVDTYDTDSDVDDKDSDLEEEWQDYLNSCNPKVVESCRFLKNWYETKFKV